MAQAALPLGVEELDELDIQIVVDNETDTLSSIDANVPQAPELAGAMARTAPTRSYEAREAKQVFDQLCCACHGFSAVVRARRGEKVRTLLFDAGPYPKVWLENAERLGVDLASIDEVFLSHWHADHSAALPEAVAAVARARRAAGRQPPLVDLHPDRPDQRGFVLPSGSVALLHPEPTFDAIERAGGIVRRRADAHALCDGLLYGSGAIPRVTEYETGFAGHVTFRGEAGASDPLLLDERFVAGCVSGRGVTILSACSHAGVVNACLAAKAAFDRPVDVVLGGFHLAGKAMELRIDATLRDLEALVAPRIVAPGHCTGWRAKAKLAAAFGGGRYAPSVVGSRYKLTRPS